MDEMTINDSEVTQKSEKSIEFELKEHLDKIDREGINFEEVKSDSTNTETIRPFIVPNFVLDFLQDKPIEIQKILITKNLSPDQKKKVEYIFRPNANELTINREAIRELISDLATKYPEIQPYFSNKMIFLGTFGFGFYERKTMVEAELIS
jgi:hypothetical protein